MGIAIVVLAFAGYFMAQREAPTIDLTEDAGAELPGTADGETDTEAELDPVSPVVYDLHPVAVVDGIADDTSGSVPEFELSSNALLAIDLSMLDRIDAHYQMSILDDTGDEISRQSVLDSFLESDRMYLQIGEHVASPGEYRLEFMEMRSDGFSSVVAEVTFRLTQ